MKHFSFFLLVRFLSERRLGPHADFKLGAASRAGHLYCIFDRARNSAFAAAFRADNHRFFFIGIIGRRHIGIWQIGSPASIAHQHFFAFGNGEYGNKKEREIRGGSLQFHIRQKRASRAKLPDRKRLLDISKYLPGSEDYEHINWGERTGRDQDIDLNRSR
jgi:hypothetical protein